ncbi:MAG: Gfo/Idh/MocA family oxidoreductase, partial [Planctomycetota bacterium]
MSQSKPNNENRRGFIRGSSLLIASALPATAAAASASRPQRLGLIGCGTSGVQLTAAAMEAGLVNLVALADSSKSQMQQASRSLKGRHPDAFCVESNARFLGQQAYRELLKLDLDWVIVAVPYGLRASMIGTALDSGTDVYSEQPLAVCPKTFSQLLESVRRTPSKLHVGNRQKLTIQHAEVLAAIREGAIGEVHTINARSYGVSPARLAMKRPAAAWRAEPSLAGDGTIQHREALMELACELFGEKPKGGRIQSQVEYGDCRFDSRVC